MADYENKDSALAETIKDSPSENIAVELHEKTEHLIGNFNDSFHELTKALELEQAKLLELEQRRKKIQDEMKNLKIEIQEEKVLFEEDMERVANEQITEASLPDPVDVLSFNIELKSEFMREFLASKTAELRNQMQKTLLGNSDELYDIKEEDEEEMADFEHASPRKDATKTNKEEIRLINNSITEKNTENPEEKNQAI